jgi:histidine phosphotransferase ChpT
VIELLAARLCHDLVGPISAVSNGAELLGDDDPEFMADAVTLVGDSARKALRRLQFYRFAYGFGGGVATAEPHALVAELFEGASVTCTYDQSVRGMPLEWQKLACNLAAFGGELLARGGEMKLIAADGGVRLEALGEHVGVSQELAEALNLTTPVRDLTSRTIGAYFTGLLARALGCRLNITEAAGRSIVATGPLAGSL